MIMTETIKAQILKVRDLGEVNMLDTNGVQYIAYQEGFFELVIFLEDNKKEYVDFIFHGDE